MARLVRRDQPTVPGAQAPAGGLTRPSGLAAHGRTAGACDRMRQRRLDEFTTWSAARDLAVAVYRATRRRAFDADPELRTELRASATALVTLVAQGYEQRTCGAFEQCLTAALSAAARLESLSYVAEDVEGFSRTAAVRLRHQIAATARLIDTLRDGAVRLGVLQRTPVATRVN